MGLPGETIEIKNGNVLINDGALPEPYLSQGAEKETLPNLKIKLDENEYFVLGDNRPRSSDSRFWGALPEEKIMGRTLVRLWPVAHAGVVVK